MVTYKEAIQSIIEREMEVIGKKLAIKTADEIEGLTINNSGEVKRMDRDGKEIIDDLVGKYEDRTGTVALSIIARTLSDMSGDQLDLPKRLENRM